MELGSEYNLSLHDLNISEDNFFSYIKELNNLLLNSGRSAIKVIPKKNGRVLLPEFVCESVINCFNYNDIVFYKINDDCSINMDDLLGKINNKIKTLYITHYFGVNQASSFLKEIKLIASEFDITIIEDTTQNLFNKRQERVADYYIASIRKWLPIPMGGVLYAEKILERGALEKSINNKRTYGAVLKELFLQYELDCNTEYRKIFSECEEEIDKEKPMIISDFSRFIISCISIKDLIRKRQENYNQLLKGLGLLNIKPIVDIKPDDCPFVFPLRVPKRDKLRQYLMDNKIYCAVHWPFDGFSREQRPQAVKNAKTLISLPVDQRYDKAHINYLLDVISDYKGELQF